MGIREPEKGKGRNILIPMLALAIFAALLVCFFIYNPNREETEEYTGEPYTFEAGSDQVFARMGNFLATASSSGMQVLDEKGATVLRRVFSLDTPALSAGSGYCAAYDIGGTSLRIGTKTGEYTQMDTGEAIISVSVSESGHMAVCTEKTGYKGLVTVYDGALEPVYEWYAGTGYVLRAEVSPDGKTLAVLCAEATGGKVHIFTLAKDQEQASFETPGELLSDMFFLDSGRLCALTSNRAVFFDDSGGERGAYDFGGLYLIDYAHDTPVLALMLSRYMSGGAGTLVLLNDSGGVKGRLESERELLSLSIEGQNVLALYADELVLYSANMAVLKSGGNVLGVKNAILRPRGDVLLISTYSAEARKF